MRLSRKINENESQEGGRESRNAISFRIVIHKRKKEMGDLSALTAKEAEVLGVGVNYAALGEDAFRLSSSRKP